MAGAIALLTSAVTLWVWGSWNPIAVVHDESAYLLQAKIFASLRWTAPGRPLPEFFEQMHVFVTPFLAKVPAGSCPRARARHLLGKAALVSVRRNGVAGALLFLLARAWRPAPSPCGLADLADRAGTWEYRASYLSETTTAVLILAAWWRSGVGTRRAGAVALPARRCPGLGSHHPAPDDVRVRAAGRRRRLEKTAVRRAWADLAAAVAVGSAILAILPLGSLGTTGEWRTTPYRYYSQVYYPYEWGGFGAREEKALRSLPSGMDPLVRRFQRIHRSTRCAPCPRR